jgi:hypothetical protein
MIKRLAKSALLAAISAVLVAGSNNLWAQTPGNAGGNRGRGARDPAQFLERRMERYREQLEVKSDDEWKVIQPRIEKVLQAQREVRVGGFGGGRRGGTASGAQPDRAAPGGGRGNRGARPDALSNPEVVALQTAVDSKASPGELKAKLAKLRETLKQKEADLAKVQEDLRQVLSVRQEAIALLAGLLR